MPSTPTALPGSANAYTHPSHPHQFTAQLTTHTTLLPHPHSTLLPHPHSTLLPHSSHTPSPWNVELWVIRAVGQTAKDDCLLPNKVEGVAQTGTRGFPQGRQTAPLPPTGQQLIQLTDNSDKRQPHMVTSDITCRSHDEVSCNCSAGSHSYTRQH